MLKAKGISNRVLLRVHHFEQIQNNTEYEYASRTEMVDVLPLRSDSSWK